MPAWLVPAIIGAAQLVGGLIGQRKQRKENRELAQFQADANERYLQQQQEYNSPKNQMLRYQEAGLNPHLIYGQGNPGSQSAPLQYPDIKSTDFQSLASSLGPLVNQSMLTQSQVQANDARIRKTGQDISLSKLQQAVLAKNPLLDEEGFAAIINSLRATAESKAAQAGVDITQSEWYQGIKTFYDKDTGKAVREGPAGVLMLERQLDLLDQRFNLGNLDSKIKAQVINSKEFQNAILEVQKNFMTAGDITPQHVLQFLQLLLMKML